MSVYPILLHTGACLWYVFFWDHFINNGSDKEQSDWDPRFRDTYEMGTRFLTNWNLGLQTLFFGGCLFHDLMKILNGPNWLKLGSKFQTILSLSFSSMVLPCAIYVFVVFWTMYAYDRENFYPKFLDSYIPSWQNHGMHTTIVPLVLAELFTTRHKFPSVTASMVIFSGFAFCYYLVFIGTYVEKGHWVYPIFNRFSFPISACLGFLFAFLQIPFTLVGKFIQNMYWGKEEKETIPKIF